MQSINGLCHLPVAIQAFPTQTLFTDLRLRLLNDGWLRRLPSTARKGPTQRPAFALLLILAATGARMGFPFPTNPYDGRTSISSALPIKLPMPFRRLRPPRVMACGSRFGWQFLRLANTSTNCCLNTVVFDRTATASV